MNSNNHGNGMLIRWITVAGVSLGMTFMLAGCQDSSEEESGGYTGRFFEDKNVAWASLRGLDSNRYGELFDHYRSLDYMLIDVEARPVGTDTEYAMVWRENTEGRPWLQNRNMDTFQLEDRMSERTGQGYRALDIEGYMRNSSLQHAAIWVENRENIKWEARWDMEESRLSDFHDRMESSGLRPIDINAYDSQNGLLMAGIWYENVDDYAWEMELNMTREEYLGQSDQLSNQGYIMIDYESYTKPAGQRYAGIWVKPNNYGAYQIRTGRDQLGYANLWRNYRDDGYRLANFSSANTDSGTRYGGIWIENSDRLHYEHATDITADIETHRATFNTNGISVAVIHQGDMVYRQGFGHADTEAGKTAHSRTVYSAASISKVFGATLAAKLEAEGQLRDGTAVNLDLSLPTDHYLGSVTDPISGEFYGSIPSHHTHTLEQLLAHIGCVPHYKDDNNPDSPYVNNRTAHYETQSMAVSSVHGADVHEKDLWDIALLPGCTIGSTRDYSTAAFTFVGAALEQATGRSLNQLLEEELFKPYGLTDTRVQFEQSTLPGNYERAVPYSNSGAASSYADNSWKTIGGGLESSAHDLARFGWMVLDGQIVNDDVRDNRLWSPVAAGCTSFSGGSCTNGLGWSGDPNFMEHGGLGSGAHTHLRIYPKDGMVIAVMANRYRDEVDGTAPNLRALVTDLHTTITTN